MGPESAETAKLAIKSADIGQTLAEALGQGVKVVPGGAGTRYYFRGFDLRGGFGSPLTAATRVSGEAAAFGALFSVAVEGVSQINAGKLQVNRLVATAATGAIKGIFLHGLQVAAVGATAAVVGASAPAWVPVAVGVGVAIGVGIVLDKVDDKFHLTDKLAEGIHKGWNHVANALAP